MRKNPWLPIDPTPQYVRSSTTLLWSRLLGTFRQMRERFFAGIIRRYREWYYETTDPKYIAVQVAARRYAALSGRRVRRVAHLARIVEESMALLSPKRRDVLAQGTVTFNGWRELPDMIEVCGIVSWEPNGDELPPFRVLIPTMEVRQRERDFILHPFEGTFSLDMGDVAGKGMSLTMSEMRKDAARERRMIALGLEAMADAIAACPRKVIPPYPAPLETYDPIKNPRKLGQ